MKVTIQSFSNLFIAFVLLFGYHSIIYSQNCEINASVTPDTIFCGQEAILSVYASGDGTVMMDENFNNGSFGPGWSSTPGSVMWNNPCSSSGVDGTTHAWMGNSTSVPRDIVTTGYDLSGATAGVTICFDLLFATQGGASPCEGPDEPAEGVYLQYSTDGGTNWVTINYFDPEGGYNTPYTQWGNWCFVIPNAAITSNTQFRWHQDADSGQDYDHWGIDNVEIVQNDVNATIIWGNPGDSYYYNYGVGSPGGENPNHVSPTSTTTYNVKITTGNSDVCTDQVTVTVIDPIYKVDINVSPSPLCVGDCATITGSAVQVIDSGGIETYQNSEYSVVTGTPSNPIPIIGGPGTINADMNINIQDLNNPTVQAGQILEVCLTGFTLTPGIGCTSSSLASIKVLLECPGGTQIILADMGDLSGNTITNMCFEVGGTPISAGSSPYTGVFAPKQPFTGMNGCTSNGVWKLKIVGVNNETCVPLGGISGWKITFDDPPIENNIDYTWSPTTSLSGPSSGTNTQSISNQVCPPATTTYDLTVSNGVAGCATHTESIQVIVGPCLPCTPPNLTINNLQECNPNTVDLNDAIDASSDPATLTFFSTQSDANSGTGAINNSVTSSGSYWVRAEDPSDPTCFSTYEIQVTVTTVTYTTSTTNPTCGNNDGTIVITPDAGFTISTYSIDGETTTQAGGTFSGLTAGSYNIVITDVNGCKGTGSETLSNTGSTDDSSFSLTDFCVGTANSATITGTAGGTFSIISPTGDGATIDVSTGAITNGVSGTIYTVQYKTSGTCPALETHTVTVNALPTLTVTSTNPTCGNNDGKIEITPGSGITINEYSIDNGTNIQSSGSFSNLDADNYLIYVKDDKGCVNTGTETLSYTGSTEDASFSLTDFCVGATNNATINGTLGGTFSIISPTGDGATIDASTGEITNGIGGTTYTIQYKTNGTCPASETQDVTVNSAPAYAVIITNSTCGDSNGAITITPNSGVNITDYSIDNGITTQGNGGFANLSADDYMIYVKDDKECEATETVTVSNTDSNDNASFSLTNFCEGTANSAIITGTAGGTFSIISPTGDGATINATTGEITNGVGGTTYSVQYQTNSACPKSATEQVTILLSPNVSFTASPDNGTAPLIVVFENTTSSSDNFTWDFGDGEVANNNNTNITHTYDSIGGYIVLLTAENSDGCLDTAISQIIVMPSPIKYSFPNIFTPNGDGKNDYFMLINSMGLEELKIIILNRWGQVVFEDDKADFKWNGQVNNSGADCSDGTYFYKAEFKDVDGTPIMEHGFIQLTRNK